MPVAEVAMPRRTSQSGTDDESRAPADASTITSAARVIGSAVGKVVAGTGRLLQRDRKSQANQKTAAPASPRNEEVGKGGGAAQSSARRRQPTAAAKKKSSGKKAGTKARPGTRRKSR
jgi:hypothetical protein